MKIIKIKIWLTVLLLLGIGTACDSEFPNPNAPSEDQVLSTREGLFTLSIGLRQYYSITALRWIVETPAVTTREVGITTTFLNMIELEDGGTSLPNFNSNVIGLWSSLMKVIYMSDQLIDNAASVPLIDGTRSGMIAYGHLFKAMSIGYLLQAYEKTVVENSLDGSSAFIDRAASLNEAISLLTQARDLLNSTPISSEFSSEVLGGNIDLLASINAYLARYQLIAGNYQAAIDAANQVSLSSTSVFTYDSQNPNPIWNRVFNGPANFKPRDNFGVPTGVFTFDEEDGRLDFFLEPLDELNQNDLPIENLVGFYTSDQSSIPLYVPGEMLLIKAEAYVRLNQLGSAVTELNTLRNKTDDPFGINADIGDYAGAQTADELLDEIYYNRRAELFLTGMSLEDSKRLGRPSPPNTATVPFSAERNRDFYPYPDVERNNNPNTPSDPAI